MFGRDCFPPLKHWLRHMATVPKGFLRYQVLELLNEKPMSGSEIMNEIEKRTNGCWKPSPGSIYPLLAWLQDNGYIIEVKKEEGVKRYTLTEKGKQLLEDQRKMLHHFSISRRFFIPPFISSFLVRLPWEETKEVREALKRLFKALFNLGLTLEEYFSEEILKEILNILNETSQKLEDLEKRLREGKT
ncbi:MAG: PadR family transcriptional regulator [Candidatus Methanomethylicaceae archaeon]